MGHIAIKVLKLCESPTYEKEQLLKVGAGGYEVMRTQRMDSEYFEYYWGSDRWNIQWGMHDRTYTTIHLESEVSMCDHSGFCGRCGVYIPLKIAGLCYACRFGQMTNKEAEERLMKNREQREQKKVR